MNFLMRTTMDAPSLLVADADPGLQATLAILLEGRANVRGSSTLAQATEQIGVGTCSKIVLITDTLLRQPCCEPDADCLSATLRSHANCCLTVLLVDSTTRCDFFSAFGMPATIARPFTIDCLLRRLDDLLRQRGEPDLWRGRLNCHVGRGLAFLACNYRQAPSLEDISRAMCLSPSRVAHLFRAELGKSPKEYLARLRVEVAKRALLESNEKLDSLAERLGFCDAPHFSRVFYKYIGLWPGDFRRINLEPCAVRATNAHLTARTGHSLALGQASRAFMDPPG